MKRFLIAALLVTTMTAAQAEIAAAVSLSLPAATLSQYAQQTQKAGARLIVRGVPVQDEKLLSSAYWSAESHERARQRAEIQHGFQRLARAARDLGTTFEIDPELFSAAGLTQVPAWIWRQSKNCSPADCRSQGLKVIRGAVTLSWATRKWLAECEAAGDSAGADEMRALLTRLGEEV